MATPHAHHPGETSPLPGLGDTVVDELSIWHSLAEGRTLTLRCESCGAPLRVSLQSAVRG